MPPRRQRNRGAGVHEHALSLLEALPLLLAMLCAAYVLKSALGINVLPDLHLSELFDF